MKGQQNITDKKEIRFSIIMPVYNAGKYLHDAIDSVLTQSFREFELILVDDGATDGSGKICDEYASHDNRVRVIHQSNEGICASRNAGIRIARGEYIGFCDHDDEYLQGYLEAADASIRQYGTVTAVDIVKFNRVNYIRYRNNETKLSYRGSTLPTQQWSRSSGYEMFTAINSVIWNGFYQADFLAKHALCFNESLKFGGEDIDFMEHALAHASNVWWIGATFYIHYINMGTSTSSTSHIALYDDYLRIIRYEMSTFGNLDGGRGAMRLRRWLDTLCAFVLMADGNRLSFITKVKMLSDYIKVLLPHTTALSLHLSAGDDRSWRFFVFCAKHNLYKIAGFAEFLWHAYPTITLTASRLLMRKKQ